MGAIKYLKDKNKVEEITPIFIRPHTNKLNDLIEVHRKRAKMSKNTFVVAAIEYFITTLENESKGIKR